MTTEKILLHPTWLALADIAWDIGHGNIKNVRIVGGVPDLGRIDPRWETQDREYKVHYAWERLAGIAWRMKEGTIRYIKIADTVPVMAVIDYPVDFMGVEVERQEKLA